MVGGGGGGAAGEARPKAFFAACSASDWAPFVGMGGAEGGGGGAERLAGGGFGAEPGGRGGGGGALRGCGEGTEADGARPDGFREAGGGIGGFLPIGGFGLNDPPLSDEEVVDVVRVDTIDVGRRLFFSAATFGIAGAAPGGGGGANPGILGGAPGGFGTEAMGSRGMALLVDSGSDRYGELLSAPVSMPAPVFRSFGMPPANIPANCGGPADAAVLRSSSSLSPPPSLLLRARFGGGGASDGRFGRAPSPGTGGAPLIGAAGPSDTLPSVGADLSLICVTFFSFVPCSMLLKRAPCTNKLGA